MNYTVITIESSNAAIILGNDIISIPKQVERRPVPFGFELIIDKFIEISRSSARGIKFEKSLMERAQMPSIVPRNVVYTIDVSNYFPNGSIEIYCVDDDISVFVPTLVPII